MAETAHNNDGVLEAVAAYWGRGFAVIDWPRGVKGTSERWADKRYDTDEKLRHAFGGEPKNVGIKLGRSSGGLVDVDLDCREAVAAADAFLPRTGMVSGRPGSPRSHRWYVSPNAETEKWIAPKSGGEKGKVLLELRSTGQQTIVPPSVHPSGERLEWYGRLEPAEVDAGKLREACRAVATAALVARRLPEEGRHDFALPLAGFLLRPGRLDEDAALGIMEAAWDAAGYPPGKDRAEAHRDLGIIVRDTAEAMDAGGEVSGGPTLDKEHAPGLPRAIAKAWGWGRDADREDDGGEGQDKASQADKLVRLAAQASLFHDPNGEVYATIPVRGHRETHRLDQKAFKNWLRHRFYQRYEKAPGGQAVTDAVGALSGRAAFDSPERETHVRVAGHDGNLYLDLANQDWEVVEVTPAGWRVVPGEAAPVRFRRPGGMLPLPRPSEDGDLAGLHRLLNLPEAGRERGWRLVVAWLVATLHPTGPYPALILQGEQGSAKSSAQELLRACVDPNSVPLRTYPRDERDLVIAANNGRVVSFDNLSGLPVWLSDALCRLSTGGGLSTRTLYTNEEETLFSAKRPLVMNGITSVATRPDLLDRSLVVELPVIPEERRRTEREVRAEFDAEHPQILAALLDAAAGALRELPDVNLERLPRMAEFAEWATAAEGSLGWEPGAFMAAYDEARADAESAAVEGEPVAEAVLSFMSDKREWAGTPRGLHEVLTAEAGEKVARTKAWPKAAQSLTPRIKRLAPVLRKMGLEFEEYEEGDKAKTRKKRLRWRDGFAPDKDRADGLPNTGGGMFRYSDVYGEVHEDEG